MTTTTLRLSKPLWTRLLWWTLFAAAFGYVEALVVVYVRRLTQMPPGLDYREIWTLRGLAWNGPAILAEMRRQGVYGTEYGREIATLLLLLGPAVRGWAGEAGSVWPCSSTRSPSGTRRTTCG